MYFLTPKNEQPTMMGRAYAKINLGLRIIRRREDGYHEIETVFHPINLFDTIELDAEGNEILIESSDPQLSTGRSNLCWKAADALRREGSAARGVKIRIDKRIPVGAGLGGGSSDAALVLRELPNLWSLRISNERLHEIAASLGSDVPYFLRPGDAFATGRGEVLDYFELSLPYWIVIIYPGIRVATRWAYEHVTRIEQIERKDFKRLLLENLDRPTEWRNKLKNDFEELIFQTHETVKQMKDMLYNAGADFALMSGSGSAVFGLFRSEQSARAIVETARNKYQTFLTEPNFRPGF
jgi:4-diphosphocytidyl-2-C-methyl-D-erythritol kinase